MKVLSTFVFQKKEFLIKPALYAFWLDNQDKLATNLHRKVRLGKTQTGKSSQNSSLIDWDWHLEKNKILLYVGKTTTLKARLGQHLRLGTEVWDKTNDDTLAKKYTNSQIRAGVEHLIKHQNGINFFHFIRERLQFYYVTEKDVILRFYAEDLAIGKGLPWINLDMER